MLQQRTTHSLSRGRGLWRKTTPPAAAFDNAVLRGLPLDKETQNFVRPRVAGACYSRIAPTPIENPQLVIASPDALRLVGIQVYADEREATQDDHVPPAELANVDELVPFLAGNALFEGSETAAQCYCGHQFGNFSGQLGDGAAVYLGEVVRGGQRWEMQLKGAGKTPFSRTADGRKVLRSTLREFLASEHMHALGIPTTRAGSVVVSHDTTVVRDMFYDGNAKYEPTAVVMRIAQSFLRFGSFEIFKETDAHTGRAGPSAHLPYKRAMLRQMLDFSIRQYFPEIERQGLEREASYVKFFEEVVRRTAALVAKWQCVGFCHGVLNTDNMSIIGDTLDYGPYGFMEHFDAQHVCNTSDDSGRYRYEAQPEICKWNCSVLADQLALVVDRQLLEPALDAYDGIYEAEYYGKMREKLGLLHKNEEEQAHDRVLIDELFDVLTETGADFTCTFRVLAGVSAFSKSATHAAVVMDLVEVSETLQQLKRRLTKFSEAQYRSVELLLKTSPEQARMYGVSQALFDQMTLERAKVQALEKTSDAERHAALRHTWTAWVDKYVSRLQRESDGAPDAAYAMHRRDKMNSVNPVFVLRNHVAQKAIDFATDGDYERVQHILYLLTHPFEESDDARDREYARPQEPETAPLYTQTHGALPNGCECFPFSLSMDSVRSEYSDSSSSLGTSRFGGGGGPNGSSGASFSFADSSSAGGSSSRLSTTRSDFLSNYEHKFLARKAEKKKKREREKRLADASSNQLTADDRRRADRERERLARKAEMAAWLPSDATLKQHDRDRQKRSREALRSVLRWYPPMASDETDARVAAATGTTVSSLAEQRKRHTEIAPLFLADSAHARDAQREQHQRLVRDQIDRDASALQRRVADLQQKMACVERLQAARRQHASPQQQTKLTPLATQSAATLPVYVQATSPGKPSTLRRRRRRNPHTLSTSFLFRDTPDEAADARALEAAELDVFLDAHKRQRRRHTAARAIQATWRMARCRRRFLTWRAWRTRTKRAFFHVWALTHRIARQAKRAATRKYLRAWREQVAGTVRLRLLELKLYREAELLPDVPKIVMNLVFMADDDDDAYTRKVLAHPMKQSYASGFVNAAFASVESLAATSSRHRVRVLRAQHLEARRAVAKKIGQQLFRLWQRVHAEQKRLGLNAQLCIKRAARQAFQKRPVWAGEKLLTVFELWARWASFARSKRLRVPMPHFPRALPLWDVWLHNYQERQVRKVKAAAKAPLARMKRCFRGFRGFAAYALRKRLAFEHATRHFAVTTTRAVLLAWRDAIAESAYHKKLLRAVLDHWRRHATRKRAMRPWKQQIQRSRLRREQQRAWGAWRNVQLRSVFKRELHRARLASQPAWRWKVQRLLLVWMDLRPQLHKWKCFVAWRHCVQRRKLFLTVRRHCHALRRKHLMYGVFSAWKAVVWKQEDEFLEDRLQLSAWDTYKELSPLLPMLFYGCFSDAAAIFAGVPTALTEGSTNAVAVIPTTTTTTSEGGDDYVLQCRQRDARTFHEALLQGSVIEARNLILNQRHLVNAVDDATGNTALHVAAGQLEDAVRRLEILTLLLSEGACTWDKPNRHGLVPAQLAPQGDEGDATRCLLARGVYAFHADGVLQRARVSSTPDSTDKDGFAESRLVWCLMARMSSEYVRGERVAGDFRREWFSELQDELWLRRGRVCFASASTFAAAIHRCRAFLNGMKRRICRSKDDVLLDLWARVQKQFRQPSCYRSASGSSRPTLVKSSTRRTLSRDLARMEEKIDLLTWLKNTPDDPTSPAAIQKAREQQAEDAAQARAREKALALGEYGAYAETLLWPVLHDEAAERALVHSFVGVLFSLAFPADVVLAEASRLEADCAQLELDVLQGFQAIMRAELRCRSPELPHGMPLLRYFTEQSDAEFFFKRELLLLDMELLRRQSQASPKVQEMADDEDSGGDRATDATSRGAVELQLEAEILLAKAQRKQRKVDKKAAACELAIAALTDANACVLLRQQPLDASQQRLREICDARICLEDARLRLASLRLKQSDWAEKSAEMLALKRSLDATATIAPETDIGEDRVDDAELLAKRAFVETQLKRYTQELKPLGSSRAGGATAGAQSSMTELRRLHKVASSALWALFVKNLFRSCCFWLAENLLKYQEQEEMLPDVGAGPDGQQHEEQEAVDEVVGEEEGDTDDDVAKDNRSALVVLRRRKTVAMAPAAAQKRVSIATIAEPVTTVVATTFAVARKASAAAAKGSAAGAGAGRRRSSVQNARATLDTMQRSAAAAELAEVQTQMMRENYATSSQLLFESDRDAMLEDERLASQRELLEAQQQHPGRSVSAVAELNAATGLPETPSSRLMDAEEIAHVANAVAQVTADDESKAQATQKRNRKRELLRRAMAQRQLQRLAARQSSSAIAAEDEKAEQDKGDQAPDEKPSRGSHTKWTPLVDGVIACEDSEAFGFGNFVVGSTDSSVAAAHLRTSPAVSTTTHKTVAAAMAESLWKRGGTVRRPGETALSAAGAGPSASPSASPSSGARGGGGGFELFASGEDELAFNAAFRVMSASKERRTTPNGRRLSSIGAVAGGGLGAVSPRQEQTDADAEADAASTGEAPPPTGGASEELSTRLAELHTPATAEQEGETRSVVTWKEVTQDEETYGGEEEEDERSAAAAARDAQQNERLRADLASLVSATDETEFFDQTLQHYLMRVRQDSFVGPRHVDGCSMDGEATGALQDPVDGDHSMAVFAGASDAGGLEADLTDNACDSASSGNSLRTPHIKWESASDERHAPPLPRPRPLHVESTRLLVPTATFGSGGGGDGASQRETAVLLEALRELERKEEDEQRQRQQQLRGEPFLLSGKTSAMAVRRQKSSVASTLLKKDASSKRTDSEATAKHESSLRLAQVASTDEKPPASPSVPKVMVAIQRKVNLLEEPKLQEDATPATILEADNTKAPSPTRRLSQQQPLPLAHCELRLERANTFSKAATKPAGAPRRRTSQVDPEPSAAPPVSLKRQPSRLPVAPVEFCLEGARALVAPSATSEAGSRATEIASSSEPAVILPELTEEQKRNIWRDFTAVPLSDTMQDAYSQLYPHLYEPVAPLSSTRATPVLENQRRPSMAGSDAVTSAASTLPTTMPLAQQISLDKRFWSAVEGFKVVGGGCGGGGGAIVTLVPLDEKTTQRRRIESAVAIYQQFLAPAAPSRLVWLSMYSDELRAVERRLLAASRALFDALQQTAQLHISTLQAQQRQHGSTL